MIYLKTCWDTSDSLPLFHLFEDGHVVATGRKLRSEAVAAICGSLTHSLSAISPLGGRGL